MALLALFLWGSASAETMTYRVKAGETLFAIAQRTGLRQEQIRRVNPSLRVTVYAGQRLKIPLPPVPAGRVRVRQGETLPRLCRRLGVSQAELRRANPKINRAGSLNAGSLLRLPPRLIAAQRAAEKRIRLARQKTAQQKAARQRQAQQRAAQAKAQTARPLTYRVRFGDSLYSISRRVGLSVEQLQRLNPAYARALPVGVTLRLSAPKPAARVVVRPAGIKTRGLWRWPVPASARVTSDFGTRVLGGEEEHHTGIDIAAPTGTAVVAARSGRVIEAHYDQAFGWGRTVVIQHADGWRTRYAHLDSIGVKVGQVLLQGARLGTIGQTGRVTGPHLHFGVYRSGTPLDPLALYGQDAD